MNKDSGVWILTSENNEYDQHGAYFRAVFERKPSIKELAEFFNCENYSGSHNVMAAVAFLEHLLEGGGRQSNEDEWFILTYVEFQGVKK